MKYSILGFNQEEVLKCKTTIDVNGKEKEVCIDVTDLLILQCVSDFMNRQCVYKYMINDKMYFSIQYQALLEDLPILNIGKQALRDRIDKLVLFNLLEKEVIRNEQGSFVVFRIGTGYEQLVYNKKGVTVCGEVEGGMYQTTHGYVSNYTPKNSTTINTSTIKEERDKSLSKKERKDELFEQCWKEYRRKGSKAKAKTQWVKLKQDEKERILQHIKAYVSSRELQYQKDFERYIKDKIFDTLVIANSRVVYDPTLSDANEYRPTLSSQLLFHNELNCYLYIGFFSGFIGDGYDDNNRPNGAEVMLNNGRGTITWNKEQKQWILKK